MRIWPKRFRLNRLSARLWKALLLIAAERR
jgi:hypothetical protein